jgi:hypothetical protein
MAKLFQVKVLCIAGLLLLFTPVASIAQQNCSLIANVVDIHYKEVAGTVVTLAGC